MKVRALRLAEVGPFSGAVAVEGFSGGLDVLTGANETGKSTLFTALGVLLAERHTTTARAVAALRPDNGGTPLIEAEIEAGGRLLRLRKRYLAQRMALLEDLRSGQVWHGADAEAAADDLFGGEATRALRGLLWVAQGESFALPAKQDAALVQGLAGLIEQEAADAAGAGHARRLAQAVRARLEELVTLRQGKPKAGGPLDDARRRRDEVLQQLEAARAKAATAEVRLARRNALRSERDAIADPQTVRALADNAAAARKAVEDADIARDRLRLSDARIATLELALEQARARCEAHERNAADVERIARAIIDGAARRDDLIARRKNAEARVAAVQAELAAREAALQDARAGLKGAHARQLADAARSEVRELDRRLAEARAAQTAIEHAQAGLAANPATEAAAAEVRRLGARIELLDARIDAEAPRAAITYLPGVGARISIDGRVLADGERLTIDGPMVLAIEGVGAIEIQPGYSAESSPLAEREVCRAALAAILTRLGASRLEDVAAMLEARQRDGASAAEGRARLQAAAPAGLDALLALREKAALRAGAEVVDATTEAASVDTLEACVRALEDEVGQQRASQAHAEGELKSLAASISGLEARLAADRDRQVDLDAHLPPAAERDGMQQRLVEAASSASSALAEAVRERSAWAEVAPVEQAYEALAVESRRAATAVGQQGERKVQLDREIAEVDGALSRDSEDGTGADIAELEQALETAEARVADLQTDVDALSLISLRLEQLGTAHREEVLRPLIGRLQVLLGRLFPGATLAMDGPLLAVRLDRAERTDALGRISGGTREQVATLVRLAYADLLAARGAHLPLVLDDALAFSDDARLETMVELLAAAAARHQVIMLSCHQRAIEPLVAKYGARLLTIEAWRTSGDQAEMPSGRTPRGRAGVSAAGARVSG